VVPTAPAYFAFLAIVFFLHWTVAERRLLRLSVLLFASYFFLARFGLWYLLLIPAAGTLDYAAGLAIERLNAPLHRRLALGFSLAMNLGLMVAIGRVEGSTSLFTLGFSFYAFQALTYTIDVYRREIKPASSYLEHLTAVSLFPTPLAGPITRVGDLLPQLAAKAALSSEQASRGLFLICLGLVKKLLIADYLADNLVNRVFDLTNLYSGFEALMGVYGYAFQVYFDFSGYTDIAIGSALLLGLKLPANFNQPYVSQSIPEFWRRWHITFSEWLRDYLYFSLPGLRSKRKIFTYGNLVITMWLGGLWHGATWNFAIWGLLHGSGLAGTRWWQTHRGRRAPSTDRWVKLACGLGTFHFVCLTWIFFRAPDLKAAQAILGRIFSLTVSAGNLSAGVLLVLAIAVVGHFLPNRWLASSIALFERAPFYAQAAAMLAVVIAIQMLAGKGAAPFVYTRF
jgi:D-alanyl-lipoteichoic acid acyltransferase DltB (MBOAT superfamily)